MSLIENRREQIFPVLDARADRDRQTLYQRRAADVRRWARPIFNVGERHAPAWLVLKGEIEITRRDGLNREARSSAWEPASSPAR